MNEVWCSKFKDTLGWVMVPKKRSVSHKFNSFPLVDVHVGSTRHKKRAVQQITARNVLSRLCHAVYRKRYSLARLRCAVCRVLRAVYRLWNALLFGTPEVCRVSCVTCRVPSMECATLWHA
ncbi:hypothetical protein RRG08_038369 [Elysia crispata]|uniref:Uncharacterized protein n=1 Tax=Elysia crispata TaxID=231223 RepID=A0AAE1A7B4_9GAST|nr:hypothetical protein RRG08_038369 [Elysia crispata]